MVLLFLSRDQLSFYYTLRDYKYWKASIYEQISLPIHATRGGAASGGVDHLI